MNREELLKVAKPILFNTEMVQAILDNRKSVTRRTIKSKYCDSIFEMYEGILCETETETPPVDLGNGLTALKVRRFVECKQPYKTGDILYVREPGMIQSMKNFSKQVKILFKAGNSLIEFDVSDKEYKRLLKYESLKRWLSPYWLTKETARIFLKVKVVRAERLQEIDRLWSNYDREGMRNPKTENISIAMQEKFIDIWNSTNKKKDIDKYSWNANPWVWVIEFERIAV